MGATVAFTDLGDFRATSFPNVSEARSRSVLFRTRNQL